MMTRHGNIANLHCVRYKYTCIHVYNQRFLISIGFILATPISRIKHKYLISNVNIDRFYY
jgi:hypothetical protein